MRSEFRRGSTVFPIVSYQSATTEKGSLPCSVRHGPSKKCESFLAEVTDFGPLVPL